MNEQTPHASSEMDNIARPVEEVSAQQAEEAQGGLGFYFGDVLVSQARGGDTAISLNFSKIEY